MKFGSGQSVRRTEDKRFITGKGRYTDDIQLENMAYLAVVRAPYAHADITALDSAGALGIGGVLAVYTQDDLDAAGYGPLPCITALDTVDGGKQHYTERPILARRRVRFVGEPVAVVVAESRAAARDGAEAVMVDYADRPAVHDAMAATAPGAADIWGHIPGNVAFDWHIGDEAAVDAALAKAAHVSTLRIVNNRVAPNAMENRAAIGEYDAASGRYTLTTGTQGVAVMQGLLAGLVLKVDPRRLRVVTPDVGGGFGMKFFLFPEYVCVLHAARMLGRPVKWTGERADSFLTDTHGRDLISEGVIGLDAEGRILGLKVASKANLGAYLSAFGPAIQTLAGGKMLGGMYAIPALYNRVKGIVSNTAPVDAYRGAGRPEAAYMTERLIDKAGREMGLGQDAIRQRNLVPEARMPFTTALGVAFDTGAPAAVLSLAKEHADWDGFAARKAASAARGLLRGRGLGYYVEITSAGNMVDYATVAFTKDGAVELAVGTQSTGQGHETAFAQILAERLGIPFDTIRVIQGDTERLARGHGTGGSRSLHIGGGAVIEGAKATIAAARPLAAYILEADEAMLDFADGHFRLRGSNRNVPLMALAALAHDAARLPAALRARYPQGLRAEARYEGAHPTFPNGCHIAEVEIDPETGQVAVVSYHAVDDFGRLMNPMLVAGQVHGGVVQGLGQALLEDVVYQPETGQLITGSFMDYAMPRADDVPDIAFANHVVANPNNPLGIKGCGEAGTIGAMPAIVHAILDALAAYGIDDIDMPATPEKIWRRLRTAQVA
ncbi:MAG: xanthine dehydrogenase family protein molybdopterin-binding subunit [Pseudomonadota bacterium]